MNVFLWRKGVYEKAPDLWSCVKWVTIKRPAKKESAPQNATKLHFAGRFTRSRERKQGLGVFFGVTVLACAEDEELFV